MTEVAIEEILDNKEDKNRTFDKKKVKEILTEINIPNLKVKEFTRIKIGE